MALNKTALKELLDSSNLVQDEKDMWLRVGFWVTENAVAYNYTEHIYKHFYISSAGDKWHIPDFIAKSLRASVIEWWDKERESLVYVPNDIDELESRRG